MKAAFFLSTNYLALLVCVHVIRVVSRFELVKPEG